MQLFYPVVVFHNPCPWRLITEWRIKRCNASKKRKVYKSSIHAFV